MPCSVKILRIDFDPQKLVPVEKKKKPQKITPFSQIKNFACNRLVPLGRYELDLNKNIKKGN